MGRHHASFLQLSILLLCCLVALFAEGQITGRPNSRDPRALSINNPQSKLLVDRRWHNIEITENRRGIVENRERRGTITFQSDGNINGGFGDGRWSLHGDSLLQIDVTPRADHKPFLSGFYSIYELTDSTLVLGQILTSSGDWKREYSLTTSTPRPYSPTVTRKEQPPDSTLKAGTVTTLHPNGRVASVRYFQEKRFKGDPKQILSFYSGYHYDASDTTWFRVLETKAFWYDSIGRIAETRRYDSLGHTLVTEYYHHRGAGTSPVIARYINNKPVIYVVAGPDSLEFDRIALSGGIDIGAVADRIVKTVNIKNPATELVTLKIEPNSTLELIASEYQIESGGSVEVPFSIVRPEGEVDERIWVSTSDSRVYFDVHLVGYHIKCSDFSNAMHSALPQKFLLLRDTDAFQMIVKATNRTTKERTYPISQHITEFTFKKGQYEFTLVGPASRKMISVEIK